MISGVCILGTAVMVLLLVAAQASEDNPLILRGVAVVPALLATICVMLGTLAFVGAALIREVMRDAENDFLGRRIEEERRVIEEYLQTQQRRERIEE